MKRLVIPFWAGFCLSVITNVSWAADIQKGFEAANRGDFATALLEWMPLAKDADAYAQYNLGVMYGNGQGVPQDFVYAHMWFNIAAATGETDAAESRSIAENQMTKADISAAQSLARKCVAKNFKDC